MKLQKLFLVGALVTSLFVCELGWTQQVKVPTPPPDKPKSGDVFNGWIRMQQMQVLVQDLFDELGWDKYTKVKLSNKKRVEIYEALVFLATDNENIEEYLESALDSVTNEAFSKFSRKKKKEYIKAVKTMLINQVNMCMRRPLGRCNEN